MEKFLIIDSHSVLHRAYHALPPLKTRKGEVVNAVYGFCLIFLKVLNEIKPDFIAAAFDLPEPTFRHKEFEKYKAKRPVYPEELYLQIERIKEIMKVLRIPVFEKAGFEADDIIGTINFLISKKQLFPKIEIVILSGDLDALQLVDSQTKVWTMKKGIKETIFYTPKEVKERYQGLTPGQLPDFRGLKGDPSDNIPGVSGIGEKGAIKLINDFGSLENLYQEIKENSQKAGAIKEGIRKKLKEYEEQAFFSKKLSQIQKDVPIEFNLGECRFGDFDKKEVIKIFNELEFYTLVDRLPADFSAEDKKEDKIEDKIEQFLKEDIFSEKVYKIEKRLIPLVRQMEENGIKIDKKNLKLLSEELGKKIEFLEDKIFEISGREFNLNSPSQLSEVLFERLKIPFEGIKKTSSGAFSTGSQELQKLKNKYPIIRFILEYRQAFKLKSSFVEKLKKLINPKDQRIHPNFHQLGAETGRMSCSEPNLQNIPIKTELGRKIRKCFVAEKDNLFLSADYSQMELRIAASLAKDRKMIDFFNQGKDIHRAVASEIFQLPEKEISGEQRNLAKALNFGIFYGMGARAFSRNAAISFKEAQQFIKKYFKEFSVLSKYREDSIKEVRKKGFAETYFGRKRFLAEINSIDQRLKAQAERMALSTKIQGTASDIIKMAMVDLFDKGIIDKDCRLILQIHDELLFEIKKEKLNYKSQRIKEVMEKIEKFEAPLKVKIEIGQNWGEITNYDKIK